MPWGKRGTGTLQQRYLCLNLITLLERSLRLIQVSPRVATSPDGDQAPDPSLNSRWALRPTTCSVNMDSSRSKNSPHTSRCMLTLTILHCCITRRNDCFTRIRMERPFFMWWLYVKIVLSMKVQSVHFVCNDLMQILYYPQKYGAPVSVGDDIMQDHTVRKSTDRPFLSTMIQYKNLMSTKGRSVRFCARQSIAEFILLNPFLHDRT